MPLRVSCDLCESMTTCHSKCTGYHIGSNQHHILSGPMLELHQPQLYQQNITTGYNYNLIHSPSSSIGSYCSQQQPALSRGGSEVTRPPSPVTNLRRGSCGDSCTAGSCGDSCCDGVGCCWRCDSSSTGSGRRVSAARAARERERCFLRSARVPGWL